MIKNIGTSLFTFFVFISVMLNGISTYAQIRVPFNPRVSAKAPVPYTNTKNYKLQGDFLMLGNTNLTLSSYELDKDNSQNSMKYVNIDNNNPWIINSSSAELVVPGGECTEIVYAGLYWSGRVHDIDKSNVSSSPNVFNVNKTARVLQSVNEVNKTVSRNTDFLYVGYRFSDVTRLGTSSGQYYPQYRITGSGRTTYEFVITNDPNNRVQYRTGTSGNFQTLESTYNTSTGVATLNTAFEIEVNGMLLKIVRFTRTTNATSNASTYQNSARIHYEVTREIEQDETRSIQLDKHKVKLKANQESYIDIIAKDSDIYYPTTGDGVMYSAYADITDYVRKNGAANYFVADMALLEGNGGGTGYYGGWGMVVIYKNASMKWRDITVFDGHAYVAGGTYNYELPISGFKATQYGNVNVTLGMMAGEGDRMISGDYFEIKRGTEFDRLSHSGNTTGNFFNSSIAVGNTPRNPNLVNNTGFDIAKFDLTNTNNKYIANNATNATFRYGSTQDTYVIYNMVFAVDAYVPEIVGENKATSFGGNTPLNNGIITPGQEFEFELDVYNKGTEAVNSSKIEIPVPSNLHYSGSTVIGGLPAGGTVAWIPPVGAPAGTTSAVTPGGTIVWNIGTLPLDATKTKLLAKLKYRFKVSDNCILLTTNVCGLEVRINGKISGTGATSQTPVGSDLVRDYGNDACAGPVYDDFMSTITVSADFLQNCNPPVENGVMQFRAFCSVPTGGFSRAEVVAKYPSGTKFFNVVPTSYNSNVGLVTGNFPVNADGSKKMYYVMVPGMEANCYAKLEISVEIVTTSPTTKNVTLCYGETISLENKLSQTGVNKQYELVYFDAANNPITGTPNPTAVGTHRYFVAEGKDGCVGPKKEFTITINALPELAIGVQNIEVCTNFDYSTTLVASTGAGFSYTWEYSTTGGATWETLNNTTFSNKVALTNNKIEVKHAESQLNGTKVRLSVSNGQCTVTSNVFEIIVKDCPAMTNPMLLNPAIQ